MPAMFERLLKQAMFVEEPFVDETQTTSTVSVVFVSVGLMIVALLLAWLFIWAYNLSKALYIAVFAGLLMLYAVAMMVLVILYRDRMSIHTFRFYLGFCVMMIIIALTNIIIFTIKGMQYIREKSGIGANIDEYLAKKF